MCRLRNADNASSPSPETSRPSSTQAPEVGRSSSPMMFISVVLPLPEGPMIDITSPARTSRSTPRSTGAVSGPSR